MIVLCVDFGIPFPDYVGLAELKAIRSFLFSFLSFLSLRFRFRVWVRALGKGSDTHRNKQHKKQRGKTAKQKGAERRTEREVGNV